MNHLHPVGYIGHSSFTRLKFFAVVQMDILFVVSFHPGLVVLTSAGASNILEYSIVIFVGRRRILGIFLFGVVTGLR